MAALLIALILGLTLALGGAGFDRHADRDGSSIPLFATLVLAAFVALVGDSAALWGYRGSVALLVGATLACGGWIWPAGSGMSRLRSALRRPSRVTVVLGVVALALALPLILLPVPLDTDAQGFGYLALMIRSGGTLTTLAPWHPEISYLYSPGALLIFATLSQLLPDISMSAVMMGAAHAAAFLFVWLAWDFGREIGLSAKPTVGSDSRQGAMAGPQTWMWASGISAALSVGLWTALMDSHYTAIFALLFSLACLTCVFRYVRTGRLIFSAQAALGLAAVAMTQPDTTVALGLGYGSLLVLGWLATDRPPLRRWLVLAAVIPLSAVAALSPWLARIWPLLGAGIRSPFAPEASQWRVLLSYHGLVWPALALAGMAIYLRRRRLWALTMAGWCAAALEVSAVGLTQRIFPSLGAALLRFTYPFSIAWHAPIIPYMALGAGALVWLSSRLNLRVIGRWFALLAATTAIVLLLAGILGQRLLALSKSRLSFYGAFASRNDVLAMRWLHDNTPSGTRVLNYPGDFDAGRDWEAHWAPVISERDCVYFRSQPFFLVDGAQPGIGGLREEQAALLAFWRDPSDLADLSLLREAGIQYVLVPDAVGDPASLARSWRWKPPALLSDARSLPAGAPYLRLVFVAGGAQVFRVSPAGSDGT